MEIFDGSENYLLTSMGNGDYSANIPTSIGTTYQLKINYKDQEITAEETLPNVTPIDSIYTSFEEGTSFTDEGYFAKNKYK